MFQQNKFLLTLKNYKYINILFLFLLSTQFSGHYFRLANFLYFGFDSNTWLFSFDYSFWLIFGFVRRGRNSSLLSLGFLCWWCLNVVFQHKFCWFMDFTIFSKNVCSISRGNCWTLEINLIFTVFIPDKWNCVSIDRARETVIRAIAFSIFWFIAILCLFLKK